VEEVEGKELVGVEGKSESVAIRLEGGEGDWKTKRQKVGQSPFSRELKEKR